MPESLLDSLEDVEKSDTVKEKILSPEERKDNYNELKKRITDEEAPYEAGRCLQCGIHCYNPYKKPFKKEKVSEEKELS